MTGFKRWLAGLLAGLVLFSWSAAPAEGSGRDTVGIQESLVSREDTPSLTLEEHLQLILDLLQKEEVQHLLKIEDVSKITTEVVWKVLAWMISHRPVTMEILREFGLAEADRACVGKIWDSADRVAGAVREYEKSEEGIELQAAAHALLNDPDFRDSLEDFLAMISSEDFREILDSFRNAAASGPEEVPGNGPLTQAAMDKHLDSGSFLGTLLLDVLGMLDRSEWARESLPALLTNDNLWALLLLLTNGSAEVNDAVANEIRLLSEDEEVYAFAERALSASSSLVKELRRLGGTVPDENPDEIPEETAP